jgi:hypothetical protein
VGGEVHEEIEVSRGHALVAGFPHRKRADAVDSAVQLRACVAEREWAKKPAKRAYYSEGMPS